MSQFTYADISLNLMNGRHDSGTVIKLVYNKMLVAECCYGKERPKFDGFPIVQCFTYSDGCGSTYASINFVKDEGWWTGRTNRNASITLC